MHPDSTAVVTVKFLVGGDVPCSLHNDGHNVVHQVVALTPHIDAVVGVGKPAVLSWEIVIDDAPSTPTSQQSVTLGLQASNNHVHALNCPPVCFLVEFPALLVQQSCGPKQHTIIPRDNRALLESFCGEKATANSIA